VDPQKALADNEINAMLLLIAFYSLSDRIQTTWYNKYTINILKDQQYIFFNELA